MTIERPMFPPRREVEIIENYAVQDAFCTTLARIERVGPCRRLVFAVPDSTTVPGDTVMIVVGKIVVPADQLATIAALLIEGAPVEAIAATARASATAH